MNEKQGVFHQFLSSSPPSSLPFHSSSLQSTHHNNNSSVFVDFMIDGMMTRSRAIDEQLVLMADQLARHDAVFTKLESLCSTVQHHNESIELIHKTHSELIELLCNSLASQQAVMTVMMIKLNQLDKHSLPTVQPLLLPLSAAPPLPFAQSHSPLTPPTNPIQPSITPPRLPKLEVPLFTGDGVLSWLSQITHFFTFH